MRRHAKAIVAISALLLLTLALGATSASAADPVAAIDPPTGITYTTVQLSGKVNPEDEDTYWRFEYSKNPSDGWNADMGRGPIPANSGETTVATELTGLEAGTQYFVRLAAWHSFEFMALSPEPNLSFATDPVSVPTVTISDPSGIAGSSAHFSGTIDPEANNPDPAFEISWSFECTPECPGLSGGTFPADGSTHVVEADITGLLPSTDYQVTLVARNAGGPVTAGPKAFKSARPAPGIDGLHAEILGPGAARLPAFVNPRNSPATYQAEWGPTVSYGNLAPAAPASLGAQDNSFHLVNVPISGLVAGATYHYRIVATNTDTGEVSLGPDSVFTAASIAQDGACPNDIFRIGFGVDLRDCRAYERVTPTQKNGRELNSEGSAASLVSVDGNTVGYKLNGAVPGAEGSFARSSFLSSRSVNGWVLRGLDIPSNPYPGVLEPVQQTQLVSDDLSHSVQISTLALAPGAVEDKVNYYLKDLETGQLQFMFTVDNHKEIEETLIRPVGNQESTRNFDHVLLGSDLALTPDAIDNDRFKLYDFTGGQLRLVTYTPEGTVSTDHVQKFDRFGMSGDGSRIFFSLLSASTTRVPGDLGLYARVNGDHTVPISVSERSGEEGQIKSGIFKWSNADGSVVYFTSSSPLTDESAPDDSGLELGTYLYRYANGELEDLAPFTTTVVNFRISRTGDYLYFEAGGALYVWHDGQLKVAIEKLFGPNEIAMELSANGKYVAFTSMGELTGYPNLNPDRCTNQGTGSGGQGVGHQCTQLFLYSVDDQTVECISCRRDGGIPSGYPSFGLSSGATVVTNDGRVFFNTPEALSPLDSNARRDVYMYRDGERSLISTGVGSADSILYGSSPSGGDVFFLTKDQLVPLDEDRFTDLYDARVNGGLASQYPPPPPPDCSGESCKSGFASPAVRATPGTASFVGGDQGSSRSAMSRCRALEGKARLATRKAKSKPPGGKRRKALRGASKLRQKASKCRTEVAR